MAEERSTTRKTSCGVLVLREEPEPAVLLLRVWRNHDLPKGVLNAGEGELECALRELEEETGIRAADVELDPGFRYSASYPVRAGRGGGSAEKTAVLFLARLRAPVRIRLSEHHGYEWRALGDDGAVRNRMIPAALAALREHLANADPRRQE
jgi:8-oxo-dGTP pyrophosphatase MutT (NUDIX family)